MTEPEPPPDPNGELLAAYEPLIASRSDIITVPLPEQEFNPGDQLTFQFNPHPFISRYGGGVHISLRSSLAQPGIDIESLSVDGKNILTLINRGHTHFRIPAGTELPVGGPYHPGTPLEEQALVNMTNAIALLDDSAVKPRVITKQESGLSHDMIYLPVVAQYHHETGDERRPIDITTLPRGTQRRDLHTAIRVFPSSLPIGVSLAPRVDAPIKLTASPKLRLPRNLALVIEGGVILGPDGTIVRHVTHINSPLLKPVNLAGEPYTHSKIFETLQEVPDGVLCRAYRFEYEEATD